ncbi:SufD family Fe-S cluster assembly protein [Thermosphaera chiliense]|uniref:SufD family Fe-S cluster assembly protein n=1 Tax=Thermosphaera chiliense TaxID=3402707 RepID=A0A7M1UNX6_9CREN|nr:SufD family Fe-S cluster assembly protein [Thermosphaera aggregans]QOR93968.1 SufD family Fe-S cluster assembly protein [Thermosphaera aggregans]
MPNTENMDKVIAKTGLPFPSEVSSIVLNEKLFVRSYIKTLSGKGIVFEDVRAAFNNKEYAEKIAVILKKNGLKKDVLEQHGLTGLFVSVPSGLKLEAPLYYCFILESPGFYQKILNIIQIEDGAQVTLAKGCAAIPEEGAHSALTLIDIGRDCDVTSIMVHNWRSKVKVGAKTSVKVGRGSVFREYYVKLTPVDSITLTSEVDAYEKSRVEIYSSTIGHRKSRVLHNTRVRLRGSGSSAIVNVRSVAHDQSFMKHDIVLEALSGETKGHVECTGLLLGDAVFETTPSLKSASMDSELTHEASLGKIKSDEVFYLMTRGLSEEEATRLIVVGFLSQVYEKLPRQLKEYLLSITRMFVSKTL